MLFVEHPLTVCNGFEGMHAKFRVIFTGTKPRIWYFMFFDSTMTTVGIDIGTGSVRVCLNGPAGFESAVKPITTTKHDVYTNYVTQSSQEIYQRIIELLHELVDKPISSLSFAATCSMVVMEKTVSNGEEFLKPYAVNYEGDDNYQDIILWMDNRSVDQANYLNGKVDKKYLNKVGGKFIPEMGLPKLRWLHENATKELVCFEMYDWFSYLFMVGGYVHDGMVPYVIDATTPMEQYKSIDEAMDGSIRGWTPQFLQNIGIGPHISIGKSDFNLGDSCLLPVGVPLGFVHDKAFALENKIVVANGCIDCYAGWLSTVEPKFISENNLTMIAGTSTCFILSTHAGKYDAIPGIWGPFPQLLPLPVDLFEFGQPATGKLFEQLFENYQLLISSLSTPDIFARLEDETSRLEASHNKPIHHIIKNYFWYIDQFGNRSPYNDFSMSEMIIDGYNSSSDLASITNGFSLMGLVIRYNLILEFLSFQTKQILDIIEDHNGPQIHSITINGSQGNNKRFMKLLSTVTGKPVKVLLLSTDIKYNVVKGASLISGLGLRLLSDPQHYETILQDVISSEQQYDVISPNEDLHPLKVLLDLKYDVFVDMSKVQQKYRRLMASM